MWANSKYISYLLCYVFFSIPASGALIFTQDDPYFEYVDTNKSGRSRVKDDQGFVLESAVDFRNCSRVPQTVKEEFPSILDTRDGRIHGYDIVWVQVDSTTGFSGSIQRGMYVIQTKGDQRLLFAKIVSDSSTFLYYVHKEEERFKLLGEKASDLVKQGAITLPIYQYENFDRSRTLQIFHFAGNETLHTHLNKLFVSDDERSYLKLCSSLGDLMGKLYQSNVVPLDVGGSVLYNNGAVRVSDDLRRLSFVDCGDFVCAPKTAHARMLRLIANTYFNFTEKQLNREIFRFIPGLSLRLKRTFPKEAIVETEDDDTPRFTLDMTAYNTEDIPSLFEDFSIDTLRRFYARNSPNNDNLRILERAMQVLSLYKDSLFVYLSAFLERAPEARSDLLSALNKAIKREKECFADYTKKDFIEYDLPYIFPTKYLQRFFLYEIKKVTYERFTQLN